MVGTWYDQEIPTHFPEHIEKTSVLWQANLTKGQSKKLGNLLKTGEELHILVMNVEAFSTQKGVDFAAPKGTPIMAAGTGYIEFIGTNGGAGKYIRIKHMNGYKTSYSHISKYASGMKKGFKVNQGQVIAFVGTTGLSTGPHLHYEVIKNGKSINSQKLKLPSGKKLKNKERKLFEVKKIKIDVLKSELILGIN